MASKERRAILYAVTGLVRHSEGADVSETIILGFDRAEEAEVREAISSLPETGTTFTLYGELAAHRRALSHAAIPSELIVLATGLPAGVFSLLRLWLGRGKAVSVERSGMKIELKNHSAKETAELLRAIGLKDDSATNE
jgi:hypothetical protein